MFSKAPLLPWFVLVIVQLLLTSNNVLGWAPKTSCTRYGSTLKSNRLTGRTTNLRSSVDDFDVSSLLYKEQERLLVERGQYEENLMSVDNGSRDGRTVEPLSANVVKGGGSRGGFGGGDSSSTTSKSKSRTKRIKKTSSTSSNSRSSTMEQLRIQGRAHASVLKKEGVVRIDNIFSKEQAGRLREYVLDLRETAMNQIKDRTAPSADYFADVLLKENRCDLKMPLDNHVTIDALASMLVDSSIGFTIETLLGPNAIFREFSCLISDPGSQRQNVHPDTPYHESGQPVLYTCFVSLQDIDVTMGPTIWLPRTHTADAHEQFYDEVVPPRRGDSTADKTESPKDKLLRSSSIVLGMLPTGGCGIFDSRLLHCGSANKAEATTSLKKSRAIFYCSFQNPNVSDPGNPGSIREDIARRKYTLQDLRMELELYRQGKSNWQVNS